MTLQIREEAERKGNRHWHRMGERCWCGYLTVPVRYHFKDQKEVSQEEAEKAYLEWEMRKHHVKGNLPVLDVPPQEMSHPVSHPCETCGKDKDYKGAECYACRKRRSRA